MRALFSDSPFVENADRVGVHHGCEPMRDHEHRLAPCERGERLLDERLVFRVGEGGRLIEHDDRRVFEDRARERDALALSA